MSMAAGFNLQLTPGHARPRPNHLYARGIRPEIHERTDQWRTECSLNGWHLSVHCPEQWLFRLQYDGKRSSYCVRLWRGNGNHSGQLTLAIRERPVLAVEKHQRRARNPRAPVDIKKAVFRRARKAPRQMLLMLGQHVDAEP